MRGIGEVALAGLLLAAGAAPALVLAQGDGDGVTADALTCWWRTSASAVRVGEPFSLVLTCAVLSTEDVKVVPDESRLDPKVIQLPPFDIVGGGRGPDVTDGPKRFFQYSYTLRLIADDKFGKDVKVPPLAISYRIRSRSAEGALSEGRDQSYELPPAAIRIVSTVPEGATDIRDGGTALFEEIDGRLFRGTVIRAIAAVCLGVSAVALLMTIAAAFRRERGRKRNLERQIPSWLVQRGVAAELARVRSERRVSGWLPQLLDRALAATRIVAAYALDIPVTIVPVKARTAVPRGTVVVPARLLPGPWAAAASSVTARTVADARTRAAGAAADSGRLLQLGDLEQALAVLTAARYGRDATMDESALDDAMAIAMAHVRGGWSDVISSLRNRRWTTVPLSVDTRVGSE